MRRLRSEDLVEELEKMWSVEDGFLFQLRAGHFVPAKAQEFLARILTVELGEGDVLPKRAVALLWYLPLFMHWQRERVPLDCRAELERVITTVTNHLEGVLGVP